MTIAELIKQYEAELEQNRRGSCVTSIAEDSHGVMWCEQILGDLRSVSGGVHSDETSEAKAQANRYR